MGKPFKIKHGLDVKDGLFKVDHLDNLVSINNVRVATIDDLVGGGGFIGDLNDLTTDHDSTLVGAINEVDAASSTAAGDIINLETNLAQEISDRTSGDSTLDDRIDQEIANRIAGDSTLQTAITSEATSRANADMLLQSLISNEVTNRATADSNLQTDINLEISNRETAVSNTYNTLHQEIVDEATARSNTDISLQTQINAITTDQNKFLMVSLDTSDVTLTETDGNFIAVEANEAGRSLILPANVPNGGLKYFIQNAGGNYSFNVLDSNNDLVASITETNALHEIVYDNANSIWYSFVIDESDPFYFTNNVDDSFNFSFTSEGETNKLLNFGPTKEFLANLIFNSATSAWKLSILNANTLAELSSINVSATEPASTTFKFDLLNDVYGSYRLVVAHNDVIEVFAFNNTNLSYIGNDTLSELGGVEIKELLVVNSSNIFIETHTATNHYIRNFDISGSTCTYNATGSFTLTETVIDDFSKIYRFNDTQFAYYRTYGNTNTKRLTLFSFNEGTITLGASQSFDTLCDDIGIIDEEHFAVVLRTNYFNVYNITNMISPIYQKGNFSSTFTDFDLTNDKSVIVTTGSTDYKSNYIKLGALIQKGSNRNKILYFTFNNATHYPLFEDTTAYEYTSTLDNRYLDDVVLNERHIFLGLCDIDGNNYNISSLNYYGYFPTSKSASSLTYAKFIEGDIAVYKNLKANEIQVFNTIEAAQFIGDGSLLTGLPTGYDQDLNTTDNVDFNIVTATTFYGDGSNLTGISQFDQSLNTTDSVQFNVVTANSFVGLPEGLKVFKIIAGEGSVNPTAIGDRTYTLPEGGTGWQIGTAATLNASNQYGVEMGTSADDLLIVHPKGIPPFIVKMQRNKNKGFPAGMGIQDYDITWKSNILNTAIRIDVFTLEEYEFWIQIVFV